MYTQDGTLIASCVQEVRLSLLDHIISHANSIRVLFASSKTIANCEDVLMFPSISSSRAPSCIDLATFIEFFNHTSSTLCTLSHLSFKRACECLKYQQLLPPNPSMRTIASGVSKKRGFRVAPSSAYRARAMARAIVQHDLVARSIHAVATASLHQLLHRRRYRRVA
jgi:hypothetical protein